MTEPAISILDAVADPDLFGPWFRKPATWRAWFAFLAVLFGHDLDDAGTELFRQCTGRTDTPPSEGFREGWLVVGRRGGKSLALALIAVFLATFKDWTPYLTPGERGTVVVIAADRKQARVIFRYITAFLKNVEMLAPLIERETQDTIELSNQISIEIQTASFKTTRGYTLIAALLDEVAFWAGDDSVNPDTEILAALRPAMATIPGAIMLAASSPYAKRGVLHDAWRKHYGQSGDRVLVWQAATRIMNPAVPQQIVDEAYDADPASAAAEYGAEFRQDIESFISREVIDSCTVASRRELPPVQGNHYVAFCDPSGGSADSMTLAIGHKDQWLDTLIVDAIREVRPPFSPDDVVSEFAGLLRNYGITSVVGDRYAGEWPRERFRFHAISYETSSRSKSDIYRETLPLLNAGTGRVELLDHTKLRTQLQNLERRTSRGGRDSIDHPPGQHDDVANSVCGALLLANERSGEARIAAVGIKMFDVKDFRNVEYGSGY